MARARSRGPSHCTSRSGSVWARNTSSRGASNSRVMMIIGMPGSAVISVLLIVVSFRCRGRVGAGILFLAVLQCRQQVIEPLVAFVPETLVAGQPRGYLTERLPPPAAAAGAWARASRGP